MPPRARAKPTPTPVSPLDFLADEAMKRIAKKTAPIDFRPDDPVGWILEHFRIPREEREDMRLILYPYQQKALRRALSKDENGLFRYSLILWGDIKKSIKSCIAAAVVLWRAWHVEHSQCYIVANTREQADSRVALYLRRAIELNPRLREVCVINRSGYSVDLPNHAHIQAIAVNAAGHAGANPTLTEFTELWGATTEEAKRLWTETTTPPNLMGKSFRWVDSYAGYEGESEVLEGIYDSGVTHGVRCDDEYDFFYENKAARQFTMWNETPRLPWQTPTYYASEEQTLTSISEYLRVHRNQWATSSSPFVPPEWWDACRKEVEPYANEPCVMAVDAGLTDDSFGIAVLSKKGNLVTVRYARAWYPPAGGQIDFVGTPDNPGPEMEIVRLCKEFTVIELAFDKTHIALLMEQLRQKHGIHVYDFSQGTLRLVADKMLRDTIRDRTIAHSGEADLSAHIKNANAKTNQSASVDSDTQKAHDTLRLVKRNHKLKIDLAVCLSMSNFELRAAYNIS